MTSNVTIALTFVMCLNVLMWLGQVSINDINPDSTQYFNCEGGLMSNYGNCNTYNMSDSTSLLPTAEGSISATTGNFFTDTFSSIKSWFLKLPGVNMIAGIVSAPYNIMKAIGLPIELCFGLGVFWYAITIFLIIAFFWGRE